MCPRLELFSTVFCELKRTVSRDFRHFFLNQKTTWTPYKQATTVLRNFSLLRRYSRKTGVGVVNDDADTDKTTRTFSENFEGFSQILKEQSVEKRYRVPVLCWCVYKPNSNNLNIWKCLYRYPYLMKNLRKRKRSRNCFRLFIWGPGRIFYAKNGRNSRDTVPLSQCLGADSELEPKTNFLVGWRQSRTLW